MLRAIRIQAAILNVMKDLAKAAPVEDSADMTERLTYFAEDPHACAAAIRALDTSSLESQGLDPELLVPGLLWRYLTDDGRKVGAGIERLVK